jgi:formylglycine-generating enzyme required for sulfatase activity
VVHVAYEDAEAFADWGACRLPTEAEWERAARGRREGAEFTWGDEPESPRRPQANYWHGEFPWRAADGYGSTSPVASFPPNDLGLYDMAGNVWEWTSDDFAHFDDVQDCCSPATGSMQQKVVKGGSFLCADSYCRRYRPAARRPQDIDTGMSHIGFRIAR